MLIVFVGHIRPKVVKGQSDVGNITSMLENNNIWKELAKNLDLNKDTKIYNIIINKNYIPSLAKEIDLNFLVF